MSSKKIIKKIFFRPSWYDILINPYFIARYSLLKEIENFSKGVKNKNLIMSCSTLKHKKNEILRKNVKQIKYNW